MCVCVCIKIFHWWSLVSHSLRHFYDCFIVRTPSHLSQLQYQDADMYLSYQVLWKISVSHNLTHFISDIFIEAFLISQES